MKKIRTDKRLNKIISALKARQHSFHVVLENIHDPHNASAIIRTCDAVGVPKASLLYTQEEFPKISKVTSASANKWIEIEKYDSVETCTSALKKLGFKIYASMIDENAANLYELDLTKKIALVFGNEHRGVSEEFQKKTDGLFFIPMRGMIQSLNVSVAAAVSLYEAQRQRALKRMYEVSELSEIEFEENIDKWCRK